MFGINNLSNSTSPILNKTIAGINQYSNKIQQLSPQINDTWATAFFSNVSNVRGEPYNYCANLSAFAKVRFNTMSNNYGISHYGYESDFNKTWPYGVSYGSYIYEGFSEEVFYHSGNASDYVSQIINTAPIHWQGLADENNTAYGYYIANGPTYEIL